MTGRELLEDALHVAGVGGCARGYGYARCGEEAAEMADTPSGAELIRRADAEPVLRAALEAIQAAHHEDTDSGMGFAPDDPSERYGRMSKVCALCGTADEFGVRWPCWTWTAANDALTTPDAPG